MTSCSAAFGCGLDARGPPATFSGLSTATGGTAPSRACGRGAPARGLRRAAGAGVTGLGAVTGTRRARGQRAGDA